MVYLICMARRELHKVNERRVSVLEYDVKYKCGNIQGFNGQNVMFLNRFWK